MANNDIIFSVSDFVAVLNQTLDYAYPDVTIVGEISNYRVSKNRWVYFDLKDEHSSIKCFGTVYMLPGPLEDGLMVQVNGTPRLHQQFGFSVNLRTVQPVGEGSLKKAAALLEKKLALEGLFDESRKRGLLYPPKRIGLITSSESAAYHDFMKILGSRWGGIDIELCDVQVQGEAAPAQIIRAIELFGSEADPVDVLVITRGGGSSDDLAAFSTEQVTRAVAGSRIPTLVAIGHEVDISLAELAADRRASTPSNAAEMLTPDRVHEQSVLAETRRQLSAALLRQVSSKQELITGKRELLSDIVLRLIDERKRSIAQTMQLLDALNPEAAMKRGYALVTSSAGVVRSVSDIKPGQALQVRLIDGSIEVEVRKVQ